MRAADRAFAWSQVAANGMRKLAPESHAWAQQARTARASDETLAWLARAALRARDWPAVREEAALAHNERTAGYLLGTPLVGDFLEEGLSMLGYSCAEYEIGRL